MGTSVKYCLAKEVPFTFSWNAFGEGVTAAITLTGKEIQVCGSEAGERQKELTDKLRSAFRKRDLEWSIHLEYNDFSKYLARHGSRDPMDTEFRLEFQEGSSLTEVLGESTSLQVEIFEVVNASGEQLYGFTTQEMRAVGQGDCRNFVDLTRNAAIHQILSEDKDQVITGKMNLILIDGARVDDRDKMVVYKRMLEEEIATDAVIVPGNGVEIKCHRGLLAAHSDVFRTMFGTDMQEAKTRKIEMPDMSEEAVCAFLAYLYHWDTSRAAESCSVAVELLKAGHKYNVGTLEEAMRKLLLSKPETWYNVDVAVKLFLFVRNLDSEWEPLKIRALMVLKMKNVNLKNSATFQELFQENQEAAMDLFLYAMSVWDSPDISLPDYTFL